MDRGTGIWACGHIDMARVGSARAHVREGRERILRSRTIGVRRAE
jgi:hypothetical protein